MAFRVRSREAGCGRCDEDFTRAALKHESRASRERSRSATRATPRRAKSGYGKAVHAKREFKGPIAQSQVHTPSSPFVEDDVGEPCVAKCKSRASRRS